MSGPKTHASRLLVDLWWLGLLRGLALMALGVIFLARPGAPLALAILLMGAYWFVDGILAVTRSVRQRGNIPYWGFGVFVGVVSIVAGLVVFSRPMAAALLTTTVLVYFLAFAALIAGFANLIAGIQMRKETDSAWYPIMGGAVSILFGLLLLASPLYSILFLIKTVGVIALVVGLVLVIYALKIRNAVKRAAE